MLALRPRKTRGHSRDAITAVVLDPEHPAPVTDPRLSTTYTASGVPARAGLELWIATDEEEEHHLLRAAGEATGAGARAIEHGLELWAGPFRWHSRGQDGAGVYLMARRA